jgi:predicted alpha/beta hydrolase
MEYVERGVDRIAVHVYPEPPGSDTFAVLWPAMGVPARYYRPFAEALGAAGVYVAVADLRGTGASTPPPSRASRYGYADLAGDVGAVLEALKARRDKRRTLLIGHSLGGQLCALHLALNDWPAGAAPAVHGAGGVDGLALIAVGLPYWRLYPGRRSGSLLAYTQAITATTKLLGVWPGWTFGGRQARRVIEDWGYTARYGRYPRLDGVDVEAALAKVATPVLAVSVEPDQYTPPSTLDHLCARLRAAPITREHYAADGIDHFKWAKHGEPLARRVAEWGLSLPS